MKRSGPLGAEIANAEYAVAERRRALRLRRLALAANARRHLSSPAVLLGAAGVGFLVATKRGRWSIGRAFSLAQLGFALFSAARR